MTAIVTRIILPRRFAPPRPHRPVTGGWVRTLTAAAGAVADGL